MKTVPRLAAPLTLGLLLAGCAGSANSPVSTDAAPTLGTLAAPNGNWTARGGIFTNGVRFDVRGVNIYGIEEAGTLHGSWSYLTEAYIARVAKLGFTAIRLPVSHETIQPGFQSTYDLRLSASTYGRKASLDIIRDVVKYARANNLAVLLDYQSCKNTLIGGSLPALPYGGPCATDRNGWLSDLRKLADIAAANPNVMGVDLYNEPRYGGDEARWLSDARAGADAVQGVAPGTLVFVSGLEQANNWGEDLRFALRPGNPLNDYDSRQKIVYSAHVYKIGAPDDDSAGWNEVIRRVRDAGKTVVLGEYGFDPGQQWGQNLVNWMKANNLRDSFYWSFNADQNSLGLLSSYDGDAGGPTKPQYDVVKGLFGAGSGTPVTPTLPLDVYRSLQVTTPGFTNKSLRHIDGLGRTEVVDGNSPALLKQDATFKVVRGLADGNCYSFQARNYPNSYLRHQDFRLKLATNDNTDLFKQDATFCTKSGLSGTGVSLEAKNLPGTYIRHIDSEVWLAKKGSTHAWDAAPSFEADVSWNAVNPWAP